MKEEQKTRENYEKKHFSEISEDERNNCFDHVAEHNIPLTISERDGQRTDDQVIHIKSYNFKTREAIIIQNKGKNPFYQEKILLIFSIKELRFLGKALIFFESKSNNYILKIDNSVFKHEKRKNFRLTLRFNKEITATAVIENTMGPFNIHDISIGGMRLIINDEMLATHSVNRLVNNIKVNIGEFSFQIQEAQIASVKFDDFRNSEIKKGKEMTRGFCIGLEFIRLSGFAEDKIGLLINKYSRKHDLLKAFGDIFK